MTRVSNRIQYPKDVSSPVRALKLYRTTNEPSIPTGEHPAVMPCICEHKTQFMIKLVMMMRRRTVVAKHVVTTSAIGVFTNRDHIAVLLPFYMYLPKHGGGSTSVMKPTKLFVAHGFDHALTQTEEEFSIISGGVLLLETLWV